MAGGMSFDLVAAASAAGDLRRLASEPDAQATHRARLAAATREGWEGPHRAGFDRQCRDHQATAAGLATRIRLLAARIDAAAAAALTAEVVATTEAEIRAVAAHTETTGGRADVPRAGAH